MPFVPSTEYLEAGINSLATQLIAPATHPVKIKLVKAPTTFTRDSDSSTFTEADYNGYAPGSETTLQTAHMDSRLQWLMLVPQQNFVPSDSLVPNTIYGYWIETDTGGYLGGEAFATPVVLDGPTKVLSFVPGFAMASFQFTAVVLP